MPKLINFKFLKAQAVTEKSTVWTQLIGQPAQFSLESRIFHSLSIGLIAIAIIYTPYNLFAGLYVGSISAFLIGLFFFYQYYYSRFHSKPHNNTLFGIIGLLIFGVNYFTNSGIHGSTDLIWPAYLLVILTISPYKQHLRWLIIYLLCFLALHTVEYYYPHLIQHPFTAGKGEFIDRITAFPMPVFVIYIIIRFIRRSYDLERKAAEEKTKQILQQKDELEQRNMEKNKLMSIISHDVKSPLMNIQNYLTLLQENALSNEERSMLEKSLQNSTMHTITMLSNLLSWSKSQMEGAIVQLAAVNVLQVLANTIALEKIQATKKYITFVDTIPPQLIIMTDVDMLQLVVRNLISNAIKFTPTGGLININAEIINNECKITINDNGKGIAPIDQEDIFSIKAAPTYGTNNEKGVGLGLVLCKEFIERLGGKIGFESKLGEGSKFFISLPLATV
ncbi:sensor histidine kinase [Pedobacter sp. LMG 31464]|uniref:histidine kinase n=1 Tax=Pedobacter planticolens TaxID=2679964 RepID=A0A923DVF8_9SPHI|nr:HAMP domain-containing sensor histidine kinase [Pedobacter planticolens]MBB2144664.1 sensor histidine kinase [Pedobacter planticolens]